ncbi:MAG: aspartate carbamoyltransferase catalytic subunit [Candidatus Tyrphobacter sp.]
MRRRRSLIDLDGLSSEDLHDIFARSAAIERGTSGAGIAGAACVNLFFEPSTRTFTSFNLAELRLGAHVVNLAPRELSYMNKGESIEDTMITLSAMGVCVVVVRHPQEGFPASLAEHFDGHVVNAGDGMHAHPTQALLDLYTMLGEFGSLDGRRVLIIGDILHSRVAHSAMLGLRTLGAEVVLAGPDALVPSAYAGDGIRVERDLDVALDGANAVMLLRIQRERFAGMPMDLEEYVRRYRLDAARLHRAAPEAIVMHPGPYNRGVELDESILRLPGWRYAQQVMHGVGVRMAVLDFLVNG